MDLQDMNLNGMIGLGRDINLLDLFLETMDEIDIINELYELLFQKMC